MKKVLAFSILASQIFSSVQSDNQLYLPKKIRKYCLDNPTNLKVQHLIGVINLPTDEKDAELKRLRIFEATRLLTDTIQISRRDIIDVTRKLIKHYTDNSEGVAGVTASSSTALTTLTVGAPPIGLFYLPEKIKKYCTDHSSDSRVKYLALTLNMAIRNPELKRLKIFEAARLLIDALQMSKKDAIDISNELMEYYKDKIISLPILPPIQPPIVIRSVSTSTSTSMPNPIASRIIDYIHQVRQAHQVQQQQQENSILTEMYTPKTTLKDIAGGVPQEVLDLQKILANDQAYVDVGVEKPFGILFYGPPGTGKSSLIKAVAGELKAALIERSGSSFINKYVGVGAKEIRNTFQQAIGLLANFSHVIVAIDEIDAVGAKRESEGDKESTRTLSELMTIMDGLNPIDMENPIKIDREKITVMATTNRLDMLDPALIRAGRFDHHIEVKHPDLNKRIAVLNYHFGRRKRKINEIADSVTGVKSSESMDWNKIASLTDGFSCAALASLIKQAALNAARHSRGISNDDFMVAIKAIKPTLPKIYDDTPPAGLYS